MTARRSVTWAARKTTLQWLTGQLPTQQKLSKWGLAPSPKCLLCGHATDTMGHALAGCKANELMRTARHHTAGRILLAALADGDHGGCIASADVGSAPACEHDGVTHHPTFSTAVEEHALLSPTTVASLRTHKHWSVPDILMIVPQKATGGKPTIHLLEIKYSRDNAPEEAAVQAGQQHAELVAALRRDNPRHHVKLHNIILGMGGSIDRALERTLAELGVKGNRAKQTLRALNTHAVTSLHAIWRARQHALGEKGVLYRARQGRGVT